MGVRHQVIEVPSPGLRAMWWSSDALHVGMKHAYDVAQVVQGRSSWWTAGRLWTSAPGSLLLKRPGDVHREVAREGAARVLVVSLPASRVEHEGRPVRVSPLVSPMDPRAGVFRRLLSSVLDGDGLQLEVAVTEAIDALHGLTLDDAHSLAVRRAIDFLQVNLAEKLALADIAAAAGVNAFTLCRAFRREVGLAPHAFLTQLRVLQAKRLLSAGHRPADVAPQVGLYDQSQLHRHFRRIVGTTPGRWQRSEGRHTSSASSCRWP